MLTKQTELLQQVPVFLPIRLNVLSRGGSPPVYDRQMPVRWDLKVPDVQFKGNLRRRIRRRHRQGALIVACPCRSGHVNLDPEWLGLIGLDRDLRPLPERIRNARRRLYLKLIFRDARRVAIDVYISHPLQSDGSGRDDGITGNMPQVTCRRCCQTGAGRTRPARCDLRERPRRESRLAADPGCRRKTLVNASLVSAVQRFPGRAMQGGEDGCHEQEQSANR